MPYNVWHSYSGMSLESGGPQHTAAATALPPLPGAAPAAAYDAPIAAASQAAAADAVPLPAPAPAHADKQALTDSLLAAMAIMVRMIIICFLVLLWLASCLSRAVLSIAS
jgi:hypothetical protein